MNIKPAETTSSKFKVIHASAAAPGVTVITSTNKPHFLKHMFDNYRRQVWPNKEWIIVLNTDKAPLKRYQAMASRFKNIRVFQHPGSRSLGQCLNFASARAKHPYIARMDDDEYYAPYYLTSIMRAFRESKAAIVGKRAYFIYLNGSKLLLQRFYAEQRYVPVLAGGTISYKKSVWRKVKFANLSLGEDVRFCRDCRRLGFKLYAGDKYNFCALRRKQYNTHTWKVSDREFIKHPFTRIVRRNCTHYEPIVNRSLNPMK
ncbi:glycosyltransferase [Paenibacillus xylaniclasticus]|uniref:glycosyltransferase n=1 Tax=Paenibacillus xylaniclasticus TaxID=588083 RepID=UPI000FD730FF|nr:MULTISPECIES: glycosyltransferase family A protein [Paenibacillus]GFN33501.1 glycosyl transferase [Paenibacillus curdlanolyticus]